MVVVLLLLIRSVRVCSMRRYAALALHRLFTVRLKQLLHVGVWLLFPPSQKKYKSHFSMSQTILILIKFIQNSINISITI